MPSTIYEEVRMLDTSARFSVTVMLVRLPCVAVKTHK